MSSRKRTTASEAPPVAVSAGGDDVRHSRGRLRRLAILGIALVLVLGFAVRPIYREVRTRQAEESYQVGTPSVGLAALEQARGWMPDDPEIVFQSARALRKTGNTAEAIKRLDQARRLGVDQDRVDRERLLTLAQSGRLDLAESRLPRLLKDSRHDSREVSEAFAEGYRLNLRFDEAAALLDAWQADDPADSRPHVIRGTMHQMLTRFPQAIEEYRTALDKGSLSPDVQLRLGQCLFESNEPGDAAQAYSAFLALRPDSLEGRLGQAQCLEQLGQLEAALAEFEKGLELDPLSFDARIGIERVLLTLGHADEVLPRLEALLELWPEDAEVLFQTMTARRRTGDVAGAKSLEDRWKAADKQVEFVQELISTAAKRPDDLEIRYTIGMLLMKHYSRPMGAQFLTGVLQIDPGHSAARAAMEEYLEKTGQTEAARMSPGDSPQPVEPHST